MFLDRYCTDQSTKRSDPLSFCPFNGQVNASLLYKRKPGHGRFGQQPPYRSGPFPKASNFHYFLVNFGSFSYILGICFLLGHTSMNNYIFWGICFLLLYYCAFVFFLGHCFLLSDLDAKPCDLPGILRMSGVTMWTLAAGTHDTFGIWNNRHKQKFKRTADYSIR